MGHRKRLKRVYAMLKASDGTTAVEYAIVAAGVVTAVVVVVGLLGDTVTALFAITF